MNNIIASHGGEGKIRGGLLLLYCCIAHKSPLKVNYEGILVWLANREGKNRYYLFVFRFYSWKHAVFENYSIRDRRAIISTGLRGRPKGPRSAPHRPRSYETVISQGELTT